MIWSALVGIAIAGGLMVPIQPQLTPAPHDVHIPAPAPRTVGMGDQRQIEGTIRTIDLSSNRIILEDGETLVVPSSLAINRSHLKPGASLRAHYEERGGRKVATAIAVRP